MLKILPSLIFFYGNASAQPNDFLASSVTTATVRFAFYRAARSNSQLCNVALVTISSSATRGHLQTDEGRVGRLSACSDAMARRDNEPSSGGFQDLQRREEGDRLGGRGEEEGGEEEGRGNMLL